MEKVVASFWNHKKVFLTGHTGFKGAWLSLWLNEMGAQVTGYSLAPLTPSLYSLLNLHNEMNSILGDIRDYAKLESSIREAAPEIIIHMAAQPLVRTSYKDPIETYSTNVMGTLNIHEIARKLPNLQALINVTTDKCYANQERKEGYKEEEALGGYDPYSSSKACSELISATYRQSYSLNVATARAGNVIGGGDWATDRLIPDIIRALQNNEIVSIRNPKSVRPWQHVLEPLSGYLLLAQKLTEDTRLAGAYNFGPQAGDVLTVEEIVKKAIGLWGQGATYSIVENQGPHEAGLLSLDCSKAKKVIGWKPQWNINQTLEKIVNWYKTIHKDSSLARTITLNEIKEYTKS